MAQAVEHVLGKDEVTSSNLVNSSRKTLHVFTWSVFCLPFSIGKLSWHNWNMDYNKEEATYIKSTLLLEWFTLKNIRKRLLSVTVAALTAFSLMAAPVSAAGWHHNGDSHHGTSSWSYHHEDGCQACNEWVCDGNKWYWFNEDGHMCTGWQSIDGCWYYLNDSGEMATGWKCLDGCWYYLNSSGKMATGWKQIGNTWYYLQSSGKM